MRQYKGMFYTSDKEIFDDINRDRAELQKLGVVYDLGEIKQAGLMYQAEYQLRVFGGYDDAKEVHQDMMATARKLNVALIITTETII